MTLSILTENTAGSHFLAEHGLSYLIGSKDRKILFDTGHSNVFLKNADRMGINLHEQVNTIVLSHGHWDHGNGLRFLENKTLISHSSAFIKRSRKGDNSNIGLALTMQEIEQRFNLILSDKPYEISEGIIFLGEIPRLFDFEAQTTSFVDENGKPDFVPDDSALAIVENQGLIILAGCSHSGICNTIEYAKKVTNNRSVKAIIGGLHLKHNNRQTEQTIQYLRNHNIVNVFPSHCTELPALSAFFKEFGTSQIKTGMRLKF